MKNIIATLALAAAVLPIAAHASTIVNVDATASNGTSINLSAGTYTVSVIGTAQGGAYNGWNDSTVNFGLPNASVAPNRWKDSFVITTGGISTSYVAPGDPKESSALLALADYQNAMLSPSSTTPGTIQLSLTSNQSVNFTVADSLFVDNWGGESFSVNQVASATPEPSTFGMMGLALAGAIGVIRKKFAK